MIRTFQNSLGQTILLFEYFEAENYIYAAFIGQQSLPVLMEAGELALRIFREKDCSKYLSDNSSMLGGKDFAYEYILNDFIPRAMTNGLKCLAYVVPPDLCNPQSVKKLELAFPPELEFMLFDKVEEARYWLLCRQN